jgi:N-sulfoglucosamine sulfohydrolase
MPAKRPNIIVITTHDSGRHFGCYGIPTVRTPAIDQLAADGVRCTDYFCTVPICCASRASMMTGTYPQTHGLMDLCFPPFDWELRSEIPHLSQIMRQAGYRSLLFGMQHEVKQPQRLEYHEIRPCTTAYGRGNALDIANGLASFLETEAAGVGPFFAQVGFFETHTPFDFGGAKPDTTLGVTVPPYLQPNETAQKTCAALQGALHQADQAIAVIRAALQRSGLEEDTILVYTTDHGVELPRAKWFLYDPGIAIALLWHWPGGGLKGGPVPTLLELAGVACPATVEGRSFADGLRGAPAPADRDAIFTLYHKTSSRSIRTKTHKLIRHFDAATDFARVPVRIEDVLARRGIGLVELFDLQADPLELKNLAQEPAQQDLLKTLDARLWRWLEAVKDPILAGPMVSPSYTKASAAYQQWRASAS